MTGVYLRGGVRVRGVGIGVGEGTGVWVVIGENIVREVGEIIRGLSVPLSGNSVLTVLKQDIPEVIVGSCIQKRRTRMKMTIINRN